MDESVKWDSHIGDVEPIRWNCAYCGSTVSVDKALKGQRRIIGSSIGSEPHYVVLCPGCGSPTHVTHPGTTSNRQIPESSYGVYVSGIKDKDISALFNEARNCISASSFTAAILCCRKLLMHVAVDLGADKDKGFAYYADYLKTQNHVTPASEGWLKAIKSRGNEENHEIKLAKSDEAKDTVDFITMLLQTVYEYPNRAAEHEKRIRQRKASQAP